MNVIISKYTFNCSILKSWIYSMLLIYFRCLKDVFDFDLLLLQNHWLWNVEYHGNTVHANWNHALVRSGSWPRLLCSHIEVAAGFSCESLVLIVMTHLPSFWASFGWAIRTWLQLYTCICLSGGYFGFMGDNYHYSKETRAFKTFWGSHLGSLVIRAGSDPDSDF